PADLIPFLQEVRRMSAGGVFVHVLPSASWRFWCMLAHYPDLVRTFARLLHREHRTNETDPQPDRSGRRSRSIRQLIGYALLDSPQGAYSNAFAELYYFRRRRWISVFEAAGYDIVEVSGNHLFYSGYGLIPGLQLRTRSALSSIFGNSATVF